MSPAEKSPLDGAQDSLGSCRMLPAILSTALTAILLGACGEEQPSTTQKKANTPQQAPRAPAPNAPEQPPGHRKMVATLARLASRSQREHHYLGSERVETQRATLRRLGERADVSTRYEAALTELNLGHERNAIAILEATRQGIQDGSLPAPDEALAQVTFQLGTAYLRLAETANCCKTPVKESCILPIAGPAQHRDVEGSTQAAKHFLAVARTTGDDDNSAQLRASARWLLNIAHLTLGTYPDGIPDDLRLPKTAFESADGGTEFRHFDNIAGDLDLDTFSLSGGAIADDFDADGDIDLMVSTWDTSGQLRFYENLDDRPGFADRTTEAGLDGLFGGLNLVQADYDNDGDLDVLVLRGAWLLDQGRRHPNSLLRNNGDNTFTDVTRDAGLTARDYPTQTAGWADFDLDGDLDLYIGNEHSSKFSAPCQLFENNGDGTFDDVAGRLGVTNDRFAKSVAWGDINDDGWPDLYVSNNGQENRLYLNQGGTSFVDVAEERGVAGPIASFPSWFWDVDNDGALDLYVSCYGTDVGHLTSYYLGQPPHVEHETARLYLGDGHGTFTDRAADYGLDYPAMPMGSNFGDLDGDGFLDVYLGTGNVYAHSVMPNVVLRNRGGSGFENVTIASGLGHLQKGHGIAFADFDHDGDLDIFAQTGGAYRGDAFYDALYENPGQDAVGANKAQAWIRLRLVGTTCNRFAIGAKICIEVERETDSGPAVQTLYRHINSGGSFGASPLTQTIGLGQSAASRIRSLSVVWPEPGRPVSTFEGIDLNRDVVITQGEATPITRKLESRPMR